MFLVEIWENYEKTGAPDYRLSLNFEDLEHQWNQGLVDVSKIAYELPTPYGGIIKPSTGTLNIFPEIVSNDFIGVNIYYTNTNEANAILLVTGVAYVNSRTSTLTTYDIYSDAPNIQIDSDLDYTGGSYTIVDIFQEYCTAFGWTLDSTLARTTDIEVDTTVKSGQLYSDMLIDLCKTYSHYFLIDTLNTTIHLRDINVGAGTPAILTEFEFFPSQYRHNIPAAKVTIDTQIAYGSPYYFGDKITLKSFHDTSDAVNLNLATRVKDICNLQPYKFSLVMPMEYVVQYGINFVNGNIVQWKDSNIDFPVAGTTITMVMHNMSFSTKDKAVLSGLVTLS